MLIGVCVFGCALGRVREIWPSFYFYLAVNLHFGAFVLIYRFLPYSIIVMEYGETPIFGSHLFCMVANCHLLRPIRFSNQIRSLLVCDVPPPQLVPAHPDDGGPRA